MVRLIPFLASLALLLTLAACDSGTQESAVPPTIQLASVGADHNAAMDYGVQAFSLLSDADRLTVLSTDTNRESFAIATVDPFMDARGYTSASVRRITIQSRGIQNETGLSAEASSFIEEILGALDRGEAGAVLDLSLASVENGASQAGLSSEELTVILATSAVAGASYDYWASLELDSGDGTGAGKLPPNCARDLALADAGGALIGGIFGGLPGAGGGAARGSLIAYFDMLHTGRCN